MKLFLPIFGILADDKKVPPRHPLNRLNRLNQFATEWMTDNLPSKQANHWIPKFNRNTARMERRFQRCGFYDDSLVHGGPGRKRREDFDGDDELVRYNKNEPREGIKQITTGYKKWASRYIGDCGRQPGRQQDRLNKWSCNLYCLYINFIVPVFCCECPGQVVYPC